MASATSMLQQSGLFSQSICLFETGAYPQCSMQYGLHAVVIPLTHGIADLLQAVLDSIQLPLEDDLNRIINVKK